MLPPAGQAGTGKTSVKRKGSPMAKPIMIQGTMSNAGKSLLAAALCRIFYQDGLRVAPFKSQNMALNSYVTRDGLEMGRAQALQAQAAGVEPSVLMNPILLKPSSDTGSQVVVLGKPVGHQSAREYFSMRIQRMPLILEAYQSLSDQNDVIVIEGAGSPAEINLKKDDIVNMGLAQRLHAPVLLVGDIDRGGVFASLYGTLMLLEEAERALVKGCVINKFRGDVELLRPGLDEIERITGKPILGVVPYLQVDVEDEDSLSGRLNDTGVRGEVDIAVVRLPHLSNFTDFDPLQRMQGVSLRYAATPGALEGADLAILPGTKNTMGDMHWLRESGLLSAIKRRAQEGGAVLGICGGYQMLGRMLRDPLSAEGGGEMEGIGLLPVETSFGLEKTTVRVQGRFMKVEGVLSALSGLPACGYEIHMGQTETQRPLVCRQSVNGAQVLQHDGAQAGNVYGCYLHGLFENAQTAQGLVDCLRTAKGLPAGICAQPADAYRQTQLDSLAQAVRESLDMGKIYRILDL